MASELARLSQENGELREALRRTQVKANADQENATTKIISTLQANNMKVKIFYTGDSDWTAEGTRTLAELFFLIAPELMVEKSAEATSGYIARMWKPSAQKKSIRPEWPIASNSLKSRFSDLAALGLMEPSKRKHPVADKTEYWTLTDLGRQIYTAIRRTRLEAGLSTQIGEAREASTDTT
jgi:hypothetical protein